jgi:hypothetical protein
MTYPEDAFFVCVLGIIQIAGLVSAWWARLNEGSHHQALSQWLFFAFLALLGATTMTSLVLDARYWLTSGTTLSVMVLAAVWDFRPTPGAGPAGPRGLPNSPHLA